MTIPDGLKDREYSKFVEAGTDRNVVRTDSNMVKTLTIGSFAVNAANISVSGAEKINGELLEVRFFNKSQTSALNMLEKECGCVFFTGSVTSGTSTEKIVPFNIPTEAAGTGPAGSTFGFRDSLVGTPQIVLSGLTSGTGITYGPIVFLYK